MRQQEVTDMNAMAGVDAGASWYLQRATASFERPQLSFDLDVDVCVIGGGLAGLTVARGVAIEGWPAEQVRAVLKSDCYFHAIHYPHAFHIDPLAYAHGLARAALAAGALIFEETPATAIDPAGVRKRIATPKARVRAAHI